MLLGVGFLAGRWSASASYLYQQIPNSEDVIRIDMKSGIKEYASDWGWVTPTRLQAERDKSFKP